MSQSFEKRGSGLIIKMSLLNVFQFIASSKIFLFPNSKEPKCVCLCLHVHFDVLEADANNTYFVKPNRQIQPSLKVITP